MTNTPPITPRNRSFDFTVPQYWLGEARAVTIFFDNLSILFPEGERFFMQAVRAHEHFVTDDKLRAEVRAFLQQEGAHSREHHRYNQRLATLGYPVAALERGVKWILQGAKKRLPKRWQLSATCALEHFTASLGHILLTHRDSLAKADPAMRGLWLWHAAEEVEHKAVAWDVYQAAGAPYLERVGIMLVTTWIFWAKIAEQQWKMMQTAGIERDPSEWFALVKYLYVSPGPMRQLARLYLDYFRPSFHPWDLDDRALITVAFSNLDAAEAA